MSESENITMECPGCKAKQDLTVWDLINIGTDPEMKEALFGWQVNIFTCGTCGFQAQLPIELLYHDPGRRFCVKYYPVDSLGTEEFYARFNTSGELIEKSGMDGCEEYGMMPHPVFDMSELLRYIVFREVAFEKGRPEGKE